MTHEPKKLKGIAWVVCSRCGLIYLRNLEIQRAVRRPCPGED